MSKGLIRPYMPFVYNFLLFTGSLLRIVEEMLCLQNLTIKMELKCI